MTVVELPEIATRVLDRAQQRGFVTRREIREELRKSGQPDGSWRDVLAILCESLHFRQGRYNYVCPFDSRLEQELLQQRRIHRSVREVIRRHRAQEHVHERRRQGRVDFIKPVRVRTADGHEYTLLSRDLSVTGIHLLGSRSFLGQKVHLWIPGEEGQLCLLVRILWTSMVGDGLFENGGAFLEKVDAAPTVNASDQPSPALPEPLS
jgi:hypothetical protein